MRQPTREEFIEVLKTLRPYVTPMLENGTPLPRICQMVAMDAFLYKFDCEMLREQLFSLERTGVFAFYQPE